MILIMNSIDFNQISFYPILFYLNCYIGKSMVILSNFLFFVVVTPIPICRGAKTD